MIGMIKNFFRTIVHRNWACERDVMAGRLAGDKKVRTFRRF
jgi:hypothetical protein